MLIISCGKPVGLIGMVTCRLRWYTELLVSEKARHLPIRNARNIGLPAVFLGSRGKCRSRVSERLQPMHSATLRTGLSVRPVFLPLLAEYDSNLPAYWIFPKRQRTTFPVRRFFFSCKTKHNRLLLFLKNHFKSSNNCLFPVFHRVPA